MEILGLLEQANLASIKIGRFGNWSLEVLLLSLPFPSLCLLPLLPPSLPSFLPPSLPSFSLKFRKFLWVHVVNLTYLCMSNFCFGRPLLRLLEMP